MLCGKVIKTHNSFSYVQVKEKLFTCKLRGKLKKARENVVTGDEVNFTELSKDTGVIEERLPRVNYLRRPPVANLDQVLLVFAAKEPDPSLLLIDRFLVLAEWSGIKQIIICFNKTDLAEEASLRKFRELYQRIGYRVLLTSASEQTGLQELRQILNGKVTVFSGPSGVGKSSLLNSLLPNAKLQTGVLSDKIKRGRHTTRLAQLLPFGVEAYLVDTPGFSMVELEELSEAELRECLPELQLYAEDCRYHGCSHSHEPDCGVKAAVEQGKLDKSRYDSYLAMLQEIRERQRLRK